MNDFSSHLVNDEQMTGMRLDKALVLILNHYSRNKIQYFIKEGFIRINDAVIDNCKYRIKLGDQIVMQLPEAKALVDQPQAMDLEIVFEDAHLIILNKPANCVVHPGAGNPDKTLVNGLLHHCQALERLPRAGLIHRLDKDTTGLIIAAKHEQSYWALVDAMKQRAIKRYYQAIVQGVMISGGDINAPIGRHPRQRTRMSVQPNGKPAQTSYRVIQRFRAHTHIELELHTGRTHQIRVHMAHIHYPIVGDPCYRRQIALKKSICNNLIQSINALKRQALHAYALTLNHPIEEKKMNFSKYWKTLVNKCDQVY